MLTHVCVDSRVLTHVCVDSCVLTRVCVDSRVLTHVCVDSRVLTRVCTDSCLRGSSGFCSPLADYLTSFLTFDLSLGPALMRVDLFTKKDCSAWVAGGLITFIMGWCLPPNLVTLKAPSCTSAVGEAPLSDRWGPLVSVPAELSSCH